MKIDQILLWGAPDQFPLILYHNLNENQPDSALGWPRQNFRIFANKIQMKIDQILLWGSPDQCLPILYYLLIENPLTNFL